MFDRKPVDKVDGLLDTSQLDVSEIFNVSSPASFTKSANDKYQLTAEIFYYATPFAVPHSANKFKPSMVLSRNNSSSNLEASVSPRSVSSYGSLPSRSASPTLPAGQRSPSELKAQFLPIGKLERGQYIVARELADFPHVLEVLSMHSSTLEGVKATSSVESVLGYINKQCGQIVSDQYAVLFPNDQLLNDIKTSRIQHHFLLPILQSILYSSRGEELIRSMMVRIGASTIVRLFDPSTKQFVYINVPSHLKAQALAPEEEACVTWIKILEEAYQVLAQKYNTVSVDDIMNLAITMLTGDYVQSIAVPKPKWLMTYDLFVSVKDKVNVFKKLIELNAPLDDIDSYLHRCDKQKRNCFIHKLNEYMLTDNPHLLQGFADSAFAERFFKKVNDKSIFRLLIEYVRLTGELLDEPGCRLLLTSMNGFYSLLKIASLLPEHKLNDLQRLLNNVENVAINDISQAKAIIGHIVTLLDQPDPTKFNNVNSTLLLEQPYQNKAFYTSSEDDLLIKLYALQHVLNHDEIVNVVMKGDVDPVTEFQNYHVYSFAGLREYEEYTYVTLRGVETDQEYHFSLHDFSRSVDSVKTSRLQNLYVASLAHSVVNDSISASRASSAVVLSPSQLSTVSASVMSSVSISDSDLLQPNHGTQLLSPRNLALLTPESQSETFNANNHLQIQQLMSTLKQLEDKNRYLEDEKRKLEELNRELQSSNSGVLEGNKQNKIVAQPQSVEPVPILPKHVESEQDGDGRKSIERSVPPPLKIAVAPGAHSTYSEPTITELADRSVLLAAGMGLSLAVVCGGVGGILGAAAAPFTLGTSIPVLMALGAVVGWIAGSVIGFSVGIACGLAKRCAAKKAKNITTTVSKCDDLSLLAHRDSPCSTVLVIGGLGENSVNTLDRGIVWNKNTGIASAVSAGTDSLGDSFIQIGSPGKTPKPSTFVAQSIVAAPDVGASAPEPEYETYGSLVAPSSAHSSAMSSCASSPSTWSMADFEKESAISAKNESVVELDSGANNQKMVANGWVRNLFKR